VSDEEQSEEVGGHQDTGQAEPQDSGQAEPLEPDPNLVSWVTRDRGSHSARDESVPDTKSED